MFEQQQLSGYWQTVLEQEMTKDYFKQLTRFLEKEYASKTIYPPKEEVFNALALTNYEDVRVVILGQDPYHGPGQAEGLSFSVKSGMPLPPSLRNIYKELADDLKVTTPTDGSLQSWAKQGVLLLNAVLTVQAHQAHSHKKQGWETFTDCLIDELNQREKPIVFILWGKPAQTKSQRIDQSRHFIIEAPHPSPLSSYRGFFGSNPFSKSNEILISMGDNEIDWSNTRKF